MRMLLTVRVQPGASKESFAWDEARGWVVRVRAPPVDGKANERVCAFLARDVFGNWTATTRTSRGCLRRCGRRRAGERSLAEPVGGATR